VAQWRANDIRKLHARRSADPRRRLGIRRHTYKTKAEAEVAHVLMAKVIEGAAVTARRTNRRIALVSLFMSALYAAQCASGWPRKARAEVPHAQTASAGGKTGARPKGRLDAILVPTANSERSQGPPVLVIVGRWPQSKVPLFMPNNSIGANLDLLFRTHREMIRSSNPLSSTRKSAQIDVTSQGQK
jgi:hypothetical protein